jgi:hypothetical protein
MMQVCPGVIIGGVSFGKIPKLLHPVDISNGTDQAAEHASHRGVECDCDASNHSIISFATSKVNANKAMVGAINSSSRRTATSVTTSTDDVVQPGHY